LNKRFAKSLYSGIQAGMKDLKELNLSRREFIRKSALAYGGILLASRISAAFGASESRRFKIGVCDWSIGRTDETSFELAKRLKLDGVEVEFGNVQNRLKLRNPEVRASYLNSAKTNNLAIPSIAMGVLNSVPLKSEPVSSVWVIDAIETCRELGARTILIACFGKGDLKGDKQGIDRVTEALKEIAPRAEKANVILGLENYLSAEDNLKILEKVGSHALKVYYDVGNSTDMGYDIYNEIRLLGNNICQFHFKDAGYVLGKGRIDFKKVQEAIFAINYSGWIILEAAAPNGIMTDYPKNVELIDSLFNS